jgi:hypothetical protein
MDKNFNSFTKKAIELNLHFNNYQKICLCHRHPIFIMKKPMNILQNEQFSYQKSKFKTYATRQI